MKGIIKTVAKTTAWIAHDLVLIGIGIGCGMTVLALKANSDIKEELEDVGDVVGGVATAVADGYDDVKANL